MLPNHKAAVDLNMVELVAAVKPNTIVFLDYLVSSGTLDSDESDVVQSKVTSAGKLNHLFNLLKTKDTGWPQLLNYLRDHQQSSLAAQLERHTEGKTLDPIGMIPKRSALEEFSLRLAEYYRLHYSNVPTMWEEPKHVKDVWVPLQIDGRGAAYWSADPVDHTKLCSRLKFTEGRNVALIKGDPGMGKTTLAKKIAYDWAMKCSSARQFTLVLSVPLRYAGKSDRFDQLAINYCFSIGAGQLIQGIEKEELRVEIEKLGSQLLIILDGLDEYANYSESPFKTVFARSFQMPSANNKEPPPMITFKMIVTSRPYACERINEEFWPLRFVILPLDADHLSDFVNYYSQTPKGVAKVTEYLKVNAEMIIKVPLIVTFVCYLADCVEEIPSNVTSLYDSLIRQMIKRENRQEKLAESIDIQKWKESRLVKTTAELAFRQIFEKPRDTFEVTSESLEKSHVTNDSFICGFLLHKFDFAKDLLKAEFLHRSVQEFFAAFYCYHLLLAGLNKDYTLEILFCGMCVGDTQLGRFFFGICSLENRFVQMTAWLRPVFGSAALIFVGAEEVINGFDNCLVDCLSEEHALVGETLRKSIGHMEVRVSGHMPEACNMPFAKLNFRKFSGDFKKALKLVVLTRDHSDDNDSWFVAGCGKVAHLAVTSNGLQELLDEQFDQITILIWRPVLHSDVERKWKDVVKQIRMLPPVKTLVLVTAEDHSPERKKFHVRISYIWRLDMKLCNFQFDIDKKQRKEALDVVADVGKLGVLTVKDRKDFDSLVFLDVTASNYCSQPLILLSLIHLAFQ